MKASSLTSVIQRIAVLKDCFGWTENKLAAGDAATQKRLNRQLSHGAELKVESLLLILDACPGVSAEWLLRGTGDMLSTGKGGIEITDVQDSFKANVCDNEVIHKMLDLLAEKDKQIDNLLKIIAK